MWHENKEYVKKVLEKIIEELFKGKGLVFENLTIGYFCDQKNPVNLSIETPDANTRVHVYMDPRNNGRFTALKILVDRKKYFFINGIAGEHLYERIVTDFLC